MAIITFCGDGNKETGNTSIAVAVAAHMSIKHNMKLLLISTNFNENTIRECFEVEKKKGTLVSSLMKNDTSAIQSGIEGLTRMLGSGKIEPRIIKDYTKVILKDRLDILLGYNGDMKEYRKMQKNYSRIISVANQYYDRVIVDLDRKLDEEVKDEIKQMSDVRVRTANQRTKDVKAVGEKINKKDELMAIGKYDENLKMNAKNITRNILKQRELVNTVPYNGKFFEAMQEGKVIDLFLNFLRITNKKEANYVFLQEVDRLTESINNKWEEVQMKKGY